MTTTLALASGDCLPAIGLGLWKIDKPDAANLVQAAIRAGYRHFDAASDYGNEAEVVCRVRAWPVGGDRLCDELWITSKLWNTYHRAAHVRLACERSLRDLRVDYLYF